MINKDIAVGTKIVCLQSWLSASIGKIFIITSVGDTLWMQDSDGREYWCYNFEDRRVRFKLASKILLRRKV